jgi:type III pantothenate kinase
MDLLVDSGNSRLKWAYSENGQLSGHGSAPHGKDIPEAAQQAWRQRPVPARVIAANVAGDAYARRLDEWVQTQWHLQVEYLQVDARQGGVEPAYAEPGRLGVDRWLALVAAHRISAADVAVIDAGTALTLDVVTATGRHEGGIIIPGLGLMMDTLLQTSSGIQSGMQPPGGQAGGVLGSDTRSCIEKGALYAVTGAVEHTLNKFGSDIAVIICGGNAPQVMAELDRECRQIPDLVLQGIRMIKGES